MIVIASGPTDKTTLKIADGRLPPANWLKTTYPVAARPVRPNTQLGSVEPRFSLIFSLVTCH
jgi:hypothetical protein